MHDLPDIPDFLRVDPNAPREPWTPAAKARARKEKKQPFHLPRSIEPAGLALLKQIEKQKAERQAERLAMLQEMRRRK